MNEEKVVNAKNKMTQKQFESKYVKTNRGKVAVLCNTEQEANELLLEASLHGYHWRTGKDYWLLSNGTGVLYDNGWMKGRQSVYYLFDGGYSSLEYYYESGRDCEYELVEFNGFGKTYRIWEVMSELDKDRTQRFVANSHYSKCDKGELVVFFKNGKVKLKESTDPDDMTIPMEPDEELMGLQFIEMQKRCSCCGSVV